MTTPAPELAVVVLSLGAPPELRAALESLRQQSIPVEIVVVNSGGGDLESVLPNDDLDARIVSVPERLWPGAARNIGIRMSRAPWIAFLASDHTIGTDWAAARLERHRRGHRAVASAVVNSHPRNLYAWAYHCSILARRLPGIPLRDASLHGVSYARCLFEQHGEFREDLRVGEDTEFNRRLPDADLPLWAPSVQTTHLNPTTFSDMSRSQYERGRRAGLYWPHWHEGPFLVRVSMRFSRLLYYSIRATRGLERCLVIASWPMMLACAWVFSRGVDAARRELSKREGSALVLEADYETGGRPQYAGDLVPSARHGGVKSSGPGKVSVPIERREIRVSNQRRNETPR
jgi:GT2 family glycosyltransferase